jgi:hypothetical protein
METKNMTRSIEQYQKGGCDIWKEFPWNHVLIAKEYKTLSEQKIEGII